MSTMELRMIGPAEAADLLTLNTHNRNPLLAAVERFATDMRHGDWRDTGIPIVVYRNAGETRLLDGQTRLMAIQRAGVTLPLYISTTNEDVQEVIDSGTPRTIGQRLILDGHQPATAAALTALITLDLTLKNGSHQAAQSLTPTMRLQLARANQRDLTWAIAAAATIRKGTRVMPHTAVVAGLIAAYRAGGADATRFVDRVANGSYLPNTAGEFNLREWIIARAETGQTYEALRRRHNRTVACWNASIQNAPMRSRSATNPPGVTRAKTVKQGLIEAAD